MTLDEWQEEHRWEYEREQAMEEFAQSSAIEWFVTLGSPDGFYWLFEQAKDRQSPERFAKWVREIGDVVSLFDPNPQSKLPPDALLVLEALYRARSTVTGVEMSNLVRRSRNTIAPIYAALKEKGLIAFPHGERMGAAITDAGRRYLKD